MGFELDTEQADRELAEGLAGIFTEMFADIPAGEVVEVDEIGPDFVRVYLRNDYGNTSTWLIEFKVGQPLEFTQVG